MELDLLPCTNCKEPRVLKLGDYCATCALEPEPRYFIIKPATLDHVARVTGISHEYLNAKQERAFENFQVYVVYGTDDDWAEVLISERFHIEGAMQQLLTKKKRDNGRMESIHATDRV